MTTNEDKHFWQRHYDNWRGSGLKVSKYAITNNLELHKLYYWCRKLGGNKKSIKSKHRPKHSRSPPVFTEIKVVPTCRVMPSECRIVLKNFEIQCGSLPDIQWLAGFHAVTGGL